MTDRREKPEDDRTDEYYRLRAVVHHQRSAIEGAAAILARAIETDDPETNEPDDDSIGAPPPTQGANEENEARSLLHRPPTRYQGVPNWASKKETLERIEGKLDNIITFLDANYGTA